MFAPENFLLMAIMLQQARNVLRAEAYNAKPRRVICFPEQQKQKPRCSTTIKETYEPRSVWNSLGPTSSDRLTDGPPSHLSLPVGPENVWRRPGGHSRSVPAVPAVPLLADARRDRSPTGGGEGGRGGYSALTENGLGQVTGWRRPRGGFSSLAESGKVMTGSAGALVIESRRLRAGPDRMAMTIHRLSETAIVVEYFLTALAAPGRCDGWKRVAH